MTPQSERLRRRFELWGLVGGLCLMAVTLHFDIDADGAVRYNMLKAAVVEHRTTADKYSIVQPILAIPLYLLGSSLRPCGSSRVSI